MKAVGGSSTAKAAPSWNNAAAEAPPPGSSLPPPSRPTYTALISRMPPGTDRAQMAIASSSTP